MLTAKKVITRAEYMADSERLHHAYYLETAQLAGMTARSLPVPLTRIKLALADGDKHLNSIPLHMWDNCALGWRYEVAQVNIHKEGYCASSLSDCVCALKALAKHLATKEA